MPRLTLPRRSFSSRNCGSRSQERSLNLVTDTNKAGTLQRSILRPVPLAGANLIEPISDIVKTLRLAAVTPFGGILCSPFH